MSTVHFFCVLCGSALEAPADSRHDLLKCQACSRNVPVPRRANGAGNFKSYPHVFPPDVLELLVKFRCTGCGSMLYADARCEGREAVCTNCGVHTGIPRWSHMSDSPRFPDAGQIARMRAGRAPARTEAPTLSPEEIDFLRGVHSRKPEAAA